jgi:hypothetical protein
MRDKKREPLKKATLYFTKNIKQLFQGNDGGTGF